jgi:hypothetical protein
MAHQQQQQLLLLLQPFRQQLILLLLSSDTASVEQYYTYSTPIEQQLQYLVAAATSLQLTTTDFNGYFFVRF